MFTVQSVIHTRFFITLRKSEADSFINQNYQNTADNYRVKNRRRDRLELDHKLLHHTPAAADIRGRVLHPAVANEEHQNQRP